MADINALPTDTAAVLVAGLDDAKIIALRRLNAIRVLCQDGNSCVTDSGLSHLVALPTLEVLDLEGSTEITDRGLPELRLLGNLRWLDLRGCPRVSENALGELRHALPKCEILQ
jgi:F-box/leucine-rich repeat protein 14